MTTKHTYRKPVILIASGVILLIVCAILVAFDPHLSYILLLLFCASLFLMLLGIFHAINASARLTNENKQKALDNTCPNCTGHQIKQQNGRLYASHNGAYNFDSHTISWEILLFIMGTFLGAPLVAIFTMPLFGIITFLLAVTYGIFRLRHVATHSVPSVLFLCVSCRSTWVVVEHRKVVL